MKVRSSGTEGHSGFTLWCRSIMSLFCVTPQSHLLVSLSSVTVLSHSTHLFLKTKCTGRDDAVHCYTLLSLSRGILQQHSLVSLFYVTLCLVNTRFPKGLRDSVALAESQPTPAILNGGKITETSWSSLFHLAYMYKPLVLFIQ